MSKKKEKRIKRLQKMPIWPAVLEMIITELVIFSLTIFICVFSLFGMINTVVLNMMKTCRSAVELVNENWSGQNLETINTILSDFAANHSEINEAFIVKKEDFSTVIPNNKMHMLEEDPFEGDAEEIFEKTGMIHFIDSDYDKTFLNLMLTPENSGTIRVEIGPDKESLNGKAPVHTKEPVRDKDEVPLDPELKKKSEEVTRAVSSELGVFLYRPQNLFRTMDIERLTRDKNYLDWALTEGNGLHTISIFSTDYSNVNVCFKTVYRLNSFQFNLIATIVIFFLIVLIFSGIYEIIKVVKLIHQRKRVNALVTTDTVTGGYNKDYFVQKARKEIFRGRKNYAVVQLRLEKYRNYCTAYGIKQGENLLEEINFTLVSQLNKRELVAHVEKSDFALLVIYQNKETLEIRIKNMMNILRERRNGQHLTFSAGICPVQEKTEDIEQVITCAGLAVPKTMKIQDEIVWFNGSMKEEQVWERRIEDDMDKALDNHEFQVYLQPKYSTKKEVLSAAEALVRWTHPVLGFISPGKFIPIFERNGFILLLDDYMLTEVAKLQANWMEQGKKLVPISVNVSRAHFAEDNLAEHICSIVDKYKVPHEFIELELTESAFFDDKAVLLTTVRKLKEFGFKVSMDDFGAGYSSLNSLKELPLDIIKLDAEFFRSVDDIERSNLIVEQTIALAKKLGMEIVAEGIETREQVDFLAKQHCDLIQGFYFSKPLPVTEFEERAYPKDK